MSAQMTSPFQRKYATILFALALLGVSFAARPAVNSSVSAGALQSDCLEPCQEELSAARAATAQYHQEINAVADGFISTHHCLEVPRVGGMGIHYINPGRMQDTAVEPQFPEILLYQPEQNGRLRLVGLEYFAPVISNGRPWRGGPNEPPPTIDNPPPMLFGRAFDGPMPGHEPGQPWHYDLHVWAWRHNPAGLFTQFNPRVSCQ